MRYMSIGIFFCVISIVFCKTNVKTLTESMGQEIIEIEGPKELPPGLEEEPGADSDEDEILPSVSSTKNTTKKTTSVASGRRNLKDVEKIDGTAPEDEEARLEKELAEIYKDSDYKDITEVTIEQKETSSTQIYVNAEEEEKPIARSKNGFKFAPDSTKKEDIEKFRTSIDNINCNDRQKLSVTSSLKTPASNESKEPNSAEKFNPTMIITHIALFLITAACI